MHNRTVCSVRCSYLQSNEVPLCVTLSGWLRGWPPVFKYGPFRTVDDPKGNLPPSRATNGPLLPVPQSAINRSPIGSRPDRNEGGDGNLLRNRPPSPTIGAGRERCPEKRAGVIDRRRPSERTRTRANARPSGRLRYIMRRLRCISISI